MHTPIVSNYLSNKFHIYAPKTILDFFFHFLNTNNLILILKILDRFFERSSKNIFIKLAILSKVGTTDTIEGIEKFVLLNLSGEDLDRINGKTAIIHSKYRKDNEVQMKRGRGRGDKPGGSKVIIPLPENFLEYLPIETPNLKIDKSNLPTVGCFTILNTHNKLNCADITQDGSLIVCGFKDGTISVWVINSEMKVDINGNYFNCYISIY